MNNTEALHGVERKKTVLVAEDEGSLRIILAEALRDAGYSVKEADDGVEALVMLNRCKDIDVLVTDINMPGLDGYRLIGAALDLRPQLRVVMMTGYTNATAPKRDSGHAIPIFHKPVPIFDIVDAVGDVLKHAPPSSSQALTVLQELNAA